MWFAGCATFHPMPERDTRGCPKSPYACSIIDAQNPEPHEIVSDLFRVHPDQPELEWRADGHVKVVAWSQAQWWQPGPKKTDRETWVTASPELKQICSQQAFATTTPLQDRLAQLLGVPLPASYDTFVEIWVKPMDLFRPCPDPAIDDSACQIEFPRDVSASHRRWINDLRATQYYQPEPEVNSNKQAYPWTQLGYTYDWSPQSPDHRGPSEFILKSGARIEVQSLTSSADYCQTAER